MSHEVVLGASWLPGPAFHSAAQQPPCEDLKGEPGFLQSCPRQLSAPFPRALVWPQWGPRADRLSHVPRGPSCTAASREYLLTEGQLKENGYPFPHPEKPGGAVIFTAEEKKPKDCEYLLHHRPGVGVLGRGPSVDRECYSQRVWTQSSGPGRLA